MICRNCNIVMKKEEVVCESCERPLHSDCSIKYKGKHYCDVCFIEKKHEDTPKEKVPDVIRRSYLEQYKSCPYSFYLESVKGVEKSSSSFAQVGIDLHDLFAIASEGKMNKKQMIEKFNEIFSSYDDKIFQKDLVLYKNRSIEEHKKFMYDKAMSSIETFYKILEIVGIKPFKVEENIIFSVGEHLPKVSITMDRIDLNDEMLDVLDWKTGAVMVGQKISADLQAPLYIYGILDKYKIPVRKFTFYYLDEGKSRVFTRVDGDNYECVVNKRVYKICLSEKIKEVQHILGDMVNNKFNIPYGRGMYFTCKTCAYKYDGNCKGADIESWTKIQ